MPTVATKPRSTLAVAFKEWKIEPSGRAEHVSGLVIKIDKQPKAARKQDFLDIQGLHKLSSSPWANKANLLIEQGIALLEA